MTDEELKELVASLAITQKETARLFKENEERQKENILLFKENAERQKENAKQQKETDRLFKENAKQQKELGKQIGGLNNKFGSDTEGLAFSSINKILEDLGMDFISQRTKKKRNGSMLEIDVLGYSSSKANAVLEQFPSFFHRTPR